MGNLDAGDLKLCANMSEYVEQTCMSENATCGKTELMSNASDVNKAYVLGCIEVCTKISQRNCNLLVIEIFRSFVLSLKCMPSHGMYFPSLRYIELTLIWSS